MANQFPNTEHFTRKINQAQRAWADGVVAIGADLDDKANIRKKLNHLLDTQYDFDSEGNFILFKPTLAREVPVRTNRDQTASYFIGSDSDNPISEDDDGFALTPWDVVTFEDDFFFTVLGSGDILVMGRCHFYKSDKEGSEHATTADYTFGYRKDSMRIFLHHSSLKYDETVNMEYKSSRYI